MSKRGFIKQFISKGIPGCFILLWVYAATAKVLDFDQFFVQLSQSPVLTSYASVLVWLVPGIEILLAVLLIFPKTRRLALIGSYLLMCMFTVYIFIILNYADYIPCSCGGILEALDWSQHLIFNVVCIILALIALIATKPEITGTDRKAYITPALRLLILTLFSTIAVVVAFRSSENTLRYNNELNRRYPHHPATLRDTIKLGYNSYYLAGFSSNELYLGNTTAPLHILKVNLTSRDTTHLQIRLNTTQRDFPFRSIKIQVSDEKLYLYDAAANILLRGNLHELRLDSVSLNHHFSLFELIDDSTAVIRTRNTLEDKHELALLNFNKPDVLKTSPNLLQPQQDGIFSTDGMLRYNAQLNRIIYTYYYRNQFILADQQLNLVRRVKTIDTTSHAQLQIEKTATARKLANVPLYVNKHAATYDRHLFIHSEVLGRNDSRQMLEDAFIIDIYDLLDYSYRFSFYLYKAKNSRLKDFRVKENWLYAIAEDQLLIYNLKPEVLKNE